MIYTVTFNPALDYRMDVGKLNIGETNRSSYEQYLPGGKGLNVSAVLNNLGAENIALGFIAGFTGNEIKRRFEEKGGKSDFIVLRNGESRINVKIKAETETEINATGPVPDNEAMNKFMQKLDNLKDGDTIILAGSIPKGMSDNLYADIAQKLSNRKIKVIADATGNLLKNILPFKPYLIKPNNHELGELFGVKLNTRSDVIPYAIKLAKTGPENVVVSLAGEGAVLATSSGDTYETEAPKGKVIDSVGAGDSLVAGFAAGGDDILHSFALGVSAGSATAFSKDLATKEEIDKLYKTLKIKKI